MTSTQKMTPERELVETEESYVQTLHYLVHSVLTPLQNWLVEITPSLEQDTNRRDKNSLFNIIKKENIDIPTVIFGNIKQILEINTFILEKLREANGERIALVKHFQLVAPSLKFYTDYIKNFENSRQLLKRLSHDVRFSTFMRAVEWQPFSKGQTVESHLAKPWQRVMKYELLLKEMKKGAESTSDKELISKLIMDMKLINHGMNRSQEACENHKLLLEKQKYYGMSDLTKPARYFVKDCDMKVIKDGKKREFSFILCNDILAWGRKQNMIQYAKFNYYDIQNIHVVRKNPDESRSFVLILSCTESIQVECGSIVECEEWLSELISLKTDQHLETLTGRKDARRVSVKQNVCEERDKGGMLIELSEFIYDNEKDVNGGSVNGIFFNNTYEVPLAVIENAKCIGYVPYEELVRLDENKTQYGIGHGGENDEYADSSTSSDYDSERRRNSSSLFSISGTKTFEDVEANNESLKAIAGGVHSVQISDDLLAEVLSSSQITGGGSGGVSQLHSSTGDIHRNLQSSRSESSLIKSHQSMPQYSHISTPPRIQATSAHIKPAATEVSSSKTDAQIGSIKGGQGIIPSNTSPISLPSAQSYPNHSQNNCVSHISPTCLPPAPPVRMGFPETVQPSPLPFGWEQKQAPDGRFYYVHHATRTTQWARPQ
jgi:hypothetical protein